jgi:hypothetical protein
MTFLAVLISFFIVGFVLIFLLMVIGLPLSRHESPYIEIGMEDIVEHTKIIEDVLLHKNEISFSHEIENISNFNLNGTKITYKDFPFGFFNLDSLDIIYHKNHRLNPRKLKNKRKYNKLKRNFDKRADELEHFLKKYSNDVVLHERKRKLKKII